MACNKENTEKFLKKNKNKKLVKVYKVLDISNKSPYMNKLYTVGENNAGKLERKQIPINRNQDIAKGIHVHLTLTSARIMETHYYYNRKTVEAWVRPSDLIGVSLDNNKAVFTKIYIDAKEIIK